MKSPKSPGRPSKAKKAKPKFKGQYGAGVVKKETAKPDKNEPNAKLKTKTVYRQKNFRCSDETAAMLKDLAKALGLSEVDALKAGVVFGSRNLPMFKTQLDRHELALMTRVTPDTIQFEPLFRAKPGGRLTVDLLVVLGDFAAIQQIEDQAVREQAFATLHEKLKLIFSKAKELRVEKETDQFLSTTLDLV